MVHPCCPHTNTIAQWRQCAATMITLCLAAVVGLQLGSESIPKGMWPPQTGLQHGLSVPFAHLFSCMSPAVQCAPRLLRTPNNTAPCQGCLRCRPTSSGGVGLVGDRAPVIVSLACKARSSTLCGACCGSLVLMSMGPWHPYAVRGWFAQQVCTRHSFPAASLEAQGSAYT